MISSPARVRFDVARNNPDNGLFMHCAEQLQVDTWDDESIEFVSKGYAPRFTEIPGGFRFLRRKWTVLASKEWAANLWGRHSIGVVADDLLTPSQ